MHRIAPFISLSIGALIVLFLLEITHPKIAIVAWVHGHSNRELDIFFKYYTKIGELPMIAGSLLAIYLRKKEWFRYALLAVVANSIIVQGLKFGIQAPRPFWELGESFRSIEGVRVLRSLSFPSGHSAAAILGCGLFASLLNNGWHQVLLCLFALLVAYSRMYLGLHYSLDVLVGIGVGLANLFLFLYLKRSADQ